MNTWTGENALNGASGKLPTADDAVDVALAAAGDVGAFERLYRHHAPRIYGLAIRMAAADDPEELTQEIFLRCWQKIGSFKGEAAFGTWLYRLGVNLILTRREKGGKRRKRELYATDEFLEQAPARAAKMDVALDFEAALRELPNGAREVLLLHDVEGFKHGEIANMLEITVGTSKSQLHRARMMMRKILRA